MAEDLFRKNLSLDRLDVELATLPSVVTWSRLEPLALSADLAPGLQALVADPLWMIGRQWQFAELRGEDAGSPVTAVLSTEQAPISRFRAGAAGDAVDVVDEVVPLEARVEAEGVARPAARIRAEAGLQLLRILGAAGIPKAREGVVARWAFGALPPVDPAAEPPQLRDDRGRARISVYEGRVPDADLVAAEVEPLAAGPGEPLRSLPAGLTVPGGAAAATKARTVLGAWLAWYRSYLVDGESVPAAWNPHRLEYAFAVQAELPSGRVVLEAPEYTSGRVDWSDFDAVEGDLGAAPADRAGVTRSAAMVPSPASFPGMPADRLWEFEDAHAYLGGLEAGPTDLVKMALVEFALTYGVDWFILPVDVAAGSVMRVASLTVRDTFGRSVPVGPARTPGGWSMFGLTASADTSSRADVFVIPPVVTHVLESDPLEEVSLFRDEMANLVWGVERVVQSPLTGEPVDRAHGAPPISLRQEMPETPTDASIIYRLMSPVADHWVPFVAVPVAGGPAGAIELERRRLVHLTDTGSYTTHPLGVLLRSAPDADPMTDHLRIAEEEVPRDGAIVTRRYQMARTPDGGRALWIGRRKRTGQGEGSSGLRFDTALRPGEL